MVLPPEATFEEFRDYVTDLRGPLPEKEIQDLWEWRQKLQGLTVVTGKGYQQMLPPDEQGLTLNERERKIVSEAKANGMDPVPVGSRWV